MKEAKHEALSGSSGNSKCCEVPIDRARLVELSKKYNILIPEHLESKKL